MAISDTYNGNGSQTNFEVTFPFASAGDLNVYVDGVLTTAWGIYGTTITMDQAPPAGTGNVLIERQTDYTQPVTTFEDGSVYIADGLNNQVNQLLYAIEEVNDKVDNLPAGGGGGAGSNVPDATAGNQFVVSDVAGTHEWQLKTVAQVQTILGIAANNNLPAAVADRFLVTQAGAGVYELQSPATIKTRLGIGANIPTPNNQSNFFMTTNGAGNAYQLTPVDTVKSNLGLGTAAYRNTGTGTGNIPMLVAAAGGGATAALPIVSGENLTNIQKPTKFMIYQVMVRADPTTTRNVPSATAGNPWLITTTSAAIEEAGGCQNMMAADPWVAILTQTPNKWNLRDPGLYRIECEQVLRRASGTDMEEVRMRLELPDDSVITEPEYRHFSWTETRPIWLRTDSGMVTSIRGEWIIRTNASNQAFWFEVRKSTTTLNNVAISRAWPGSNTEFDYLAAVVKIYKMG